MTASDEEIKELLPRPDRALQSAALLKFVDAFPMTVTGKMQKFLMREASVEEFGLQAAASVTTA